MNLKKLTVLFQSGFEAVYNIETSNGVIIELSFNECTEILRSMGTELKDLNMSGMNVSMNQCSLEYHLYTDTVIPMKR
jgi:hypothetical protein